MQFHILLVIGIFILSGCAQMEWVNPNKNESEFYSDKYKCEQQAASSFPIATANIAYTSGYQQPITTNCSGNSFGNNTNVSCITTPGGYTPPATILVDANANNRNQAITSCMYSNGWRLREKGKQMTRTQNQYN